MTVKAQPMIFTVQLQVLITKDTELGTTSIRLPQTE
jgi:hypothetical protein